MKKKKASTRGVGDLLGAKKLAPVPYQSRTQKVKAIARPLGTQGARPRVDHTSLGVGDDPVAAKIQSGIDSARKHKGAVLPKMKPSKATRNPEAPRNKAVKGAALPKPKGGVLGLQLAPRTEPRAEVGRPFEPREVRVPQEGALAAQPYQRQMIVLGLHRFGIPHDGEGISGRGSEEPEFKSRKR